MSALRELATDTTNADRWRPCSWLMDAAKFYSHTSPQRAPGVIKSVSNCAFPDWIGIDGVARQGLAGLAPKLRNFVRVQRPIDHIADARANLRR